MGRYGGNGDTQRIPCFVFLLHRVRILSLLHIEMDTNARKRQEEWFNQFLAVEQEVRFGDL